LIDLDHFKAINDQHGHTAGDALLKAFARRLTDGIRKSDICARWGGEEFAALLPGATIDQAREVMDRLRGSLSRTHLPLAGGENVTFSCGLTLVRSHDELDAATERADRALYVAKRGGRDQVTSAE